MPGNNPNIPINESLYNTNSYNSDPGSVNGSSKPRLTIKIPNSNSNSNNTNTNVTDKIIYDIEVAQYELIGALDTNSDKAAQYADVLDDKLMEFYQLIKNTNKNYKKSATEHVEDMVKKVKVAIEKFKKRSTPETKMNLFNKLKVKRKTRKSRK
jgi:hypothetical protein